MDQIQINDAVLPWCVHATPLAEFDAAEGSKAKEACFQKHRLDFTGKQFLKWNDDHTEEIDGTYVTTGTWPKGSMWAVNPLPETPTELFKSPCKSGAKPPIRALMAVGLYGTIPGPCAGNWPTTVNIVDHVRVPTNIAPGEYGIVNSLRRFGTGAATLLPRKIGAVVRKTLLVPTHPRIQS